MFKGKTLKVYGEAGLTDTPASKVYDTQCPGQSGNGQSLSDIDNSATDPNCNRFLKLTSVQQQTWIPALRQEQYWGMDPALTTAENLVRACRDFGAQNMVRLSNELKGITSYASWGSETKLGFTWRSSIAIGSPKTGSDVQVLGGGTSMDNKPIPTYSPGSACGFDPTTDAVIPLTLFMANTTAGRDTIPTAAKWSLSIVKGATPVTTAYLESNFSDSGTKCSDSADATSGASMGVKYAETSDFRDANSYSVVLKNWISPRYPEGAKQDLAAYVLTAQSDSTGSEDPVLNAGSASILLDGSVKP